MDLFLRQYFFLKCFKCFSFFLFFRKIFIDCIYQYRHHFIMQTFITQKILPVFFSRHCNPTILFSFLQIRLHRWSGSDTEKWWQVYFEFLLADYDSCRPPQFVVFFKKHINFSLSHIYFCFVMFYAFRNGLPRFWRQRFPIVQVAGRANHVHDHPDGERVWGAKELRNRAKRSQKFYRRWNCTPDDIGTCRTCLRELEWKEIKPIPETVH